MDSPKVHPPGSPAPSSPFTPVPIPKSRLNRVDSITLLHNMNNLYTEDQPNAPTAEAPTPRTDKLKKANEKLSKSKNERREERRRGGAGRKSKTSWVEEIETTTYIEEQHRGPNLERRDSIQLQQALQGANTVFGVHSDSPRWKKIATINRKRAKRKSEKSKSNLTAPHNVGITFDSDEYDSDSDEEGKEEEKGKEEGEGKEEEEEEKGEEEKVRRNNNRTLLHSTT